MSFNHARWSRSAVLLSSYIMLLPGLRRPHSELLNMHHILPPPSGRCWWSHWCKRLAHPAISFVPLWRFRFFVICGRKKIISETSTGIHCMGLNLKRWISFESSESTLNLIVRPHFKFEILHILLLRSNLEHFFCFLLHVGGRKLEWKFFQVEKTFLLLLALVRV